MSILKHPFCSCDDPVPPPGPGPGPITLGGDVVGNSSSTTVERIQNVPVDTSGGNTGDVMTLDTDGTLKLLPVPVPPVPPTPVAEDVAYDNTTSGLVADDVQEAIDELAARPSGSGDSFILASETIDLPTASSPHDVLVYTVPACVDATITFVLLSIEEQLQGTGNITVRAGTTSGDDDLIIDSVVDSTTLKGNFAGKDISTLGTIWPASTGYVWNAAEGDEIHVRVTTSGTVDSGKIRVTVVGVLVR